MFEPQNRHTTTITLTGIECAAAAAFAKRIEDANKRNKRRNKQGLRVSAEQSLAMRVSGMQGEAALAKALGYAQNVLADAWRSRPDVGAYDVMTTKLERGSLIFTPRDQLLMKKVLVVDCCPVFHVCGWYLCEDAREHKRDAAGKNPLWQTYREGGGAWYVPQYLLRPIPELTSLR